MSDIENSSLDNPEKKQSGTPMLQRCIGVVYGTSYAVIQRVISRFKRRSVSGESPADDIPDQPVQLSQVDKAPSDRLGDTAEMPESNQPVQQEEQGLPTEQIIVPIDDVGLSETSEMKISQATITDVIHGRFTDLSNNLQELSRHFENIQSSINEISSQIAGGVHNDLAREDTNGDLESSSENVKNLQSSINELSSQITAKIKNDLIHQETIRKMDLELQEYKQDKLFDVIRPICTAMIVLYDHVGMYKSDNDEGMHDVLSKIQEEISDSLRIAGAEEYSSEGKEFHPSAFIQAIETEETVSDDLNGTVSKTITKGYGLRGKVIRPERVSVYKKQQ